MTHRNSRFVSLLFIIFVSACGLARPSLTQKEAMIILSPTTEYVFDGDEELTLSYQQRISFSEQYLSTSRGQMRDLPSYYIARTYIKNMLGDLMNKESNCIFEKRTGRVTCDTKGKELRVMTATENALFGSRDSLNQTVLEKKDFAFKVLASRTIPNDSHHLTLIIDYVADGDEIYALVGTENLETKESKEEIWKLNADTLETEIVYLIMVGTALDAHYHSLVKVDDTFYLANSVTGKRADDQLGPGNHLLSYHIPTGEMKKIVVETAYPTDLVYNREKKELIVHHQDTYVKGYIHTIVNLETKEQRVLSFDGKVSDDEAAPHCVIHHGDYYFLFHKKLYRYNSTKNEMIETDLSKFGIKQAENLMFYTKKD